MFHAGVWSSKHNLEVLVKGAWPLDGPANGSSVQASIAMGARSMIGGVSSKDPHLGLLGVLQGQRK